MIVCAECGAKNDDAARSCESCGARFDERSGAAPFKVEDRPLHASRAEELLTPAALAEEDAMAQIPVRGLFAVAEPRNPLAVLVLSFITCYVYLVYWWYMVGKEIKASTGREDLNPGVDLLLNILTCSLFSIYLSYKYPKLILEMEERVQVEEKDQSLVAIILSLFSLGPIAAYLLQTDLNRIWEAARRRG